MKKEIKIKDEDHKKNNTGIWPDYYQEDGVGFTTKIKVKHTDGLFYLVRISVGNDDIHFTDEYYNDFLVTVENAIENIIINPDSEIFTLYEQE